MIWHIDSHPSILCVVFAASTCASKLQLTMQVLDRNKFTLSSQLTESGNVEIESASVDCSRDQDKIENGIPVVSVCDRGKRMGNYGTSSRIYTVDYEIKGDRRKMLGKTIIVGNVP